MKQKHFIFLFVFILLINNGMGYVIDGDSVIYESAYAKMKVTPHTANSFVADYEQVFNIKNKMSVGGDLCIAYIFDDPLSNSDIWLKKIGSRNVWIPDVHCDNETVDNGTIEVCLDLGHQESEDYEYYDRIKQYVSRKVIGGKYVYYSNTPLHFDALETREWKIRYSPKGSEGKWDLKVWNTISGDCENAYSDPGDRNFLETLDPWWTENYHYGILINCSNVYDGMPMKIQNASDPGGFYIDGDRQAVWTQCHDDLYLLYNGSSNYVVVNGSELIQPFWVEYGTGTSYQESDVFANASENYGMSNYSEPVANHVISTNSGAISSTNCIYGNCTRFDTNTDYMKVTTPDIFAGSTKMTAIFWINATTQNTLNYAFKSGTDDNDRSWRIYFVNGVLKFYYATTSAIAFAGGGYADVGDIFDTGVWDMFAVTRNAGDIRFYENGVNLAAVFDGGNSTAAIRNPTGDFWLGGYVSNSIMSYLDSVQFYDFQYNASMINMSYQNGLGTIGYATLAVLETKNLAPYIVNVNYTPASIYGDVDSIFWVYVRDDDGDSVTSYYNVTYSNGSIISTGSGSGDFYVNVSHLNYSHFDVINISVTPCDVIECGNNSNNVSFTVANYLPDILNITYNPATVYNFTDMTWYVWVNDDDGDSVTSYYNVTYSNGSLIDSGSGVDNFSVILTADHYEVGDVLIFSVYPNDGYVNGSSMNKTVTIQELNLITPSDDYSILAIIILLPLLFAFILIYGVDKLSQEHNVLRLFAFLLSFICLFASFHFGMVAIIELYDLEVFQDLIGSTIYWITMIFFVFLIYFLLWILKNAFDLMAQKKKDKYNY